MLNLKGVHSGYGRLKILRGINLDVPQGGVVALLGGNGTGKSTLLKTVSGLVPLMEGSIEFDGRVISGLKPHEIVRSGLVQVTQSKEAYPAMTVEENLMLGAYTRSDRGVSEDLERVYSFFPVLKKRRKVLSGTLSGGEVQMLVIGRGLMARPTSCASASRRFISGFATYGRRSPISAISWRAATGTGPNSNKRQP
ncbi:MAG: ATP-binding cassette domain-containing protein [Alphaproteobacteria bacterium]|nr:ATP-binding cassette domain-containing protein [Alphaproteobacteria bacterium]